MRDCSRMYLSGSTCPVKVAASVRSLEYLSINSRFSRFRDRRGYCKEAQEPSDPPIQLNAPPSTQALLRVWTVNGSP